MGWLTGGDPAGRTNAELRRRVASLEATVAALVRHTALDPRSVTPVPACSDEVQRLAREGREVAAIKLHRQETGLGLAEAKADVDALKR